MRKLILATVAVLLCLALPTAAQGRAKTLDGHVIAPPSVSKSRVSVPVLLTERSERRLRLGKAVVRVVIPRKTKLSAPAPTGRGKVKIGASALRAGDQLKAAVSISRKQLRRLRKRAVPALKVKRPRVPRRASALSTDELMRVVESLAAQLSALSGRVDGLAALTDSQFRSLLVRIQAVEARVTALETALGNLELSVADLLDRLDLLEASLPDPAQLAQLVSDVQSLLTRVTALEALTSTLGNNLSALTTTVTSQQSAISALQGQVTPLMTEVTSLGTRVTNVETTLTQLPGLITQVTSLDTALTTLDGRVDTAETALTTLDGTVSGLQTTVGTLDTTVDGLVDTSALQSTDIGDLQADSLDVISGVAALTGTVSGLQSDVAGIQGDVAGLQSDVAGLQGTIGTICGMAIITVC